MYLRAGYPLSLIRNGLPFDYPRLRNNAKTGIVVIGAGITGALCAFYLRRQGLDVMVVDARTVGLGSTCASTSLLLYELDLPLFKLATLKGDQAARAVYRASAAAIPKLKNIAHIVGCRNFSMAESLYCAATEKHLNLLAKEFEARKLAGLNVKWMHESAILRKYGLVAPAAILSTLAAETDAYMLTHDIHQYNIAKGVRIFDRTTIGDIEAYRNGLVLHTTDGYIIHAKQAVYATGYETVRALGIGADLTTTYVAATEQMPEAMIRQLKHTVIWNTADPYLYLRTTADNRLLIGGRDEPWSARSMEDATVKRKAKLLAKDAGKLMPGLEFRTEFSWSGTFGSMQDGMPVIDVYPELPGCFLALGLGGNGISFSVVGAELVTALITGGWDRNLAHLRIR